MVIYISLLGVWRMSQEYLYKNDTQGNTQVDTQVIVKYDTLQLGFIEHTPEIHSWVEIYPDIDSFKAKIDFLLRCGYEKCPM